VLTSPTPIFSKEATENCAGFISIVTDSTYGKSGSAFGRS
jgi:hypothetical protein